MEPLYHPGGARWGASYAGNPTSYAAAAPAACQEPGRLVQWHHSKNPSWKEAEPVRRKAVLLCSLAFGLVCVGIFLFLRMFMAAEPPYLYITWETVQRVGEDGTRTTPPVDDFGQVTGMEDGAWYCFSAEVSGLPEDALLLISGSGAELAVRIDGEEVFASSDSASYGGATLGLDQISIPLPPDAEACRIEVACRLLDPGAAIYPPLAQISSNWLMDADTMAYANLYGIPASASALVFLLVWGLFLLGIVASRPNGSLLVLALAAGLLAAVSFNQGCGFYFLPGGLNQLLNWQGFSWLIPLLLLLYLLLNRRRGFLRLLGWVSLGALALLLAGAAVSALRGGYLAAYLRDEITLLFQQGYYNGLLYWVTVYLTLVCAGISAYDLTRTLGGMMAETQALRVKNQLTLKNYQETLAKNQETAALRHEWQNQVAALDLLCRTEDWDGLRRHLQEMEGRLARLSPHVYTNHGAINTILQSAAGRAESLGVTFQAQVLVPDQLRIDEGDLCTLLLNMLDNAVEAAAQAGTPPGREVRCKLHLTQGFLAIRCENTCSGLPEVDQNGELRTTKTDAEGHGLGLRQMRAVAEKYHSVLDIQYTADRFTVQTALQIPAEPQENRTDA